MFDEDKYMESDDLMRSILSQAQEEVPEHIWEGISSELDRIEAAGTGRLSSCGSDGLQLRPPQPPL